MDQKVIELEKRVERLECIISKLIPLYGDYILNLNLRTGIATNAPESSEMLYRSIYDDCEKVNKE